MSRKTRLTAGISLAFVAALSLSACSGATSGGTTTEESSAAPMPSASASASSEMMDPTANLVGSGCAAYAEAVPDGSGSVAGMAVDPVATAASNNPILTTLTAAVSGGLNPDVNLVDTLNGGDFTVFAPVDDAFAKIDPATIEALKTDSATLTSILTYHVVPGMIQPDEIVGTHATVQGGDLTVEGSGDNLTVNGTSAVICGGVQTANAVVYLIDTVLTPPAS
ncbi:fasciclin domain-containing protein [Microbacterium sp. P01]|uniref:fasciclin domain-containing protein n=1 Tax=unclassified Microbacterium TaxID=2609290 RepID=UPI00366FA1C2